MKNVPVVDGEAELQPSYNAPQSALTACTGYLQKRVLNAMVQISGQMTAQM